MDFTSREVKTLFTYSLCHKLGIISELAQVEVSTSDGDSTSEDAMLEMFDLHKEVFSSNPG